MSNVKAHTRTRDGRTLYVKQHARRGDRQTKPRKLVLPRTDGWLRDWAAGKQGARQRVQAAAMDLLKERIMKNAKIAAEVSWSKVKGIAKHVIAESMEKIDFRATVKELKDAGMKHGPRFLAYAIAIEVFEDVILPAFLIAIGKPALAPLALAFHMEPVAYPAYFAVAKMVDKYKQNKATVKAVFGVAL